jgi:hypothetical protein
MLIACAALDPGFIAGTGGKWSRPDNDLVSYIVALEYFVLYDVASLIRSVRKKTSHPSRDLINEPRLDGWIGQHTRVWQYPSYECGGLETSLRASGDSAARNRELQIQLAAANTGVPINSALVSRTLKDCPAEERWASPPQLEDGVLYVLSYDAVKTSPPLQQIAHSHACERLQWWMVCSSSWASARWRSP